jgi:hypothetical protein
MIAPCSTRHSSDSLSDSSPSSPYPSAFSILRDGTRKKLSQHQWKRVLSRLAFTTLFFSAFLLSPDRLRADISQEEMSGQSQDIDAGHSKYQTLGSGLSGNLQSIDLAYFADTTYYGVEVHVRLEECSDEDYGICTIVAEAENSGPGSGIRTFDMGDYSFDSTKHYRLVLYGRGPFGSMGRLYYFGSSDDVYPNGAYSDSGIVDLYFKLNGADVADPIEACCSNVMFLPGLQASRLYGIEEETELSGEVRLWEPSTVTGTLLSRLSLDVEGKSIRSEI